MKVKYTKQLENGAFKRVTEPYLVAGFSFTDAEASIYENLGNVIRGEFMVTDIKRVDYHDIFDETNGCADKYFIAKISFDKGERPLIAQKGVKRSTETINKIFSKRPMNKLEKFVSNILDENNIKYTHQFFLNKDGICKSYDFKIKDTNILRNILMIKSFGLQPFLQFNLRF